MTMRLARRVVAGATPRRALTSETAEHVARVYALIEASPEGDERQGSLEGSLSGARSRVGRLLAEAGSERRGVELLQRFVDDASAHPAESRARGAMMLHHLHKDRHNYRAALMAAVAGKLAAEEACGVRSLEYAATLGAQASAARLAGDAATAGQVFLYAASVAEDVSRLVAQRARHMGAVCLAEARQEENAAGELRSLLRELQRQHAGVQHASCGIAQANVGRVELMRGNTEGAIVLLEEAVHSLHAVLSRAHPFSRQAERWWAIADLHSANVEPLRDTLLAELRQNLPV